jgi:PPK2 family polyphosphate:nucleotide phosphotransferase
METAMGKEQKKNMRKIERFIEPYRVSGGERFRLKDHDPGDTGELKSDRKPEARELLAKGVRWLAEEQTKLYAQDRHSVLLIFQAMDAAGKDGVIRHVMSGINPQGCQVFSFKQPSMEELDHDFLWRYHSRLPERGRIGVFNRSYYEEVLVVRVHPEFLVPQWLPNELRMDHKKLWKVRYGEINEFERVNRQSGNTLFLKFFLNLSRGEQKARFLERLDQPEKNWKFSQADVDERGRWDQYMKAYEEAIRSTATPEAPWFVVPADNKWFTRLVVAAAVLDALGKLELSFPEMGESAKKDLARARRRLMSEEE